MHPLDLAIASTLPLLAAARHSELPELDVGKRRLILGREGLYLEARSPAVHLCVRLHVIDNVPLPFGEPMEFVRLRHGPIPTRLIRTLVDAAVEASPIETALAIIADEAGYHVVNVPIEQSSAGHVRYRDEIDDDQLVIDMHSHGRLNAYFSSTDDESDRSRRGPYISVVVGRCDSQVTAEIDTRVSCSPYLVPINRELLATLIKDGT